MLSSTHSGKPSCYYHVDIQGNISAITDSDKNIISSLKYCPFEKMNGAERDDSRYSFSSKEEDKMTRLSYYGYRFYGHQIGRWISRDPLQENGDLAVYRYAYNSPLRYLDGLGLKAEPSPSGNEFSPDGKPKGCNKCCTNSDGKKGNLQCEWQSSTGEVSGDLVDVVKHNAEKPSIAVNHAMGYLSEVSGIGNPDIFDMEHSHMNPTLCFERPVCQEGWIVSSGFLLVDSQTGTHVRDENGNPRGTNDAPDHDGKGRICYELDTLGNKGWAWYSPPNVQLGIWCTKCQ